MHREPSFSMQSHSKPKHEHPNEMVGSPLFSPFSNMSNIDDSHIMNTSARLSSIRNPRRESMGSALDPFDRYVNPHSAIHEAHSSTQGSLEDNSRFHYDRDDSRMSIDSSPSDIRHS